MSQEHDKNFVDQFLEWEITQQSIMKLDHQTLLGILNMLTPAVVQNSSQLQNLQAQLAHLQHQIRCGQENIAKLSQIQKKHKERMQTYKDTITKNQQKLAQAKKIYASLK